MAENMQIELTPEQAAELQRIWKTHGDRFGSLFCQPDFRKDGQCTLYVGTLTFTEHRALNALLRRFLEHRARAQANNIIDQVRRVSKN